MIRKTKPKLKNVELLLKYLNENLKKEKNGNTDRTKN
jgi:hypothetical protein